MNKIYDDAVSALLGLVQDGMPLAAGGFGLCGIPKALILALRDGGAKHLTVANNNAGLDNWDLYFCCRTDRSARWFRAM